MSENTDDTRLVTILLVIIGAFVIFPMFFMGFGMMGFEPMMGGMWDDGRWGDGTMPGWMFIVGTLMQLLILAALVGAGYLLYRAIAGSKSGSNQALENSGSRTLVAS